MNKTRRKSIEYLIAKLEDIKIQIDALCEEEQEAYESLPENLQYSERGEKMDEAVSQLEYASSNIDDCIDNLYEAIEQ